MLNLTEEQKRMFYTSGYSNNYILTFLDTDLIIDNETIHSETPVIKESICDEEEFTLGGCIASSMEFEVSELLANEMAGLEYTVHIEVKNESDEVVLTVPMGIFRVDNSELVDDKDYKKVTAYDRMYDISEDVAAWYNEYFADGATHTVKETRESLLKYLGIPFVVQTLPNDDVTLEKTIEVTSMSGTDALRSLCIINGGFGRMNREGNFEIISLIGFGLFPEDSLEDDKNLYPAETLYPEDYFEYLGVSDDENACPEYRSCKYEEYMTMPITCLNIQSTTDDVGVTVGDDLSNPYVITANFFLYGKSQEELAEIGQNIMEGIKGITYRPNSTELDGLPYMECGDVYALEKKNDSVESYIFSRTISGIQALKDTYEAKGNYVRANEVSANDEIIQLKGKSLEIKKSVEELSSELTDFEKSASTKFTQTDEAISLEAKRATEAEEELSSSIDVAAESISTEVKRATEKEGELLSSIEQNAKEIVLKVDENGNIVEVGLTADPKEGTKFTVTAKNIELSADEVLNLLSGGTINLTGQNINIESNNFSVTEDGEVTAKSIDISGGTINIETGYDSTDEIRFKYIDSANNKYIEVLLSNDEISMLNKTNNGITVGQTTYYEFYKTVLTGDGIDFLAGAIGDDGGIIGSNDAHLSVNGSGRASTGEYLSPRLESSLPMKAPNIQSGTGSVETTTAGSPAAVDITFPQAFSSTPIVVCTPRTEVPGTTVKGMGVKDITTTGFKAYLTRGTTGTTNFNWIAICSYY